MAQEQGRSQDFTLGATELSAEGARIEAPRREDWGGGAPSPTDCGDLGSVVSPLAGLGAEPRSPTHCWHI